jgi:hypothetical protein
MEQHTERAERNLAKVPATLVAVIAVFVVVAVIGIILLVA